MWRSKKFLIVAVLAAIILAGTIGGIAFAQDGDQDTPAPQILHDELLDKVAEIYEENTGTAIDADELRKAFTEAREEVNTQLRERMHQRLIDEGLITQEQLDELQQWLESRPELATDEFNEWLESRPDIGLGPFGNMDGERFGPRMHGKFGQRGFGRFGGGFPGLCQPDEVPF